MSVWKRSRPGTDSPVDVEGTDANSVAEAPDRGGSPRMEERADVDTVEGERGIQSVNRARSLQSRVSSVLAIGLLLTLGLGLVGWYYAHTVSNRTRVRSDAQTASKNKAQGEMALPALGRIDPPPLAHPIAAVTAAGPPEPSAMERVLGPPPEPPPGPTMPAGGSASPYGSPSSSEEVAAKTPAQLAYERRLAGPVFSDRREGVSPETLPATPPYIRSGSEVPGSADGMPATADSSGPPGFPREDGESGSRASVDGGLAAVLRPTVTPAVRAQVLPTQRLLLAKGSFLDCTLETAIDSTLPGMTTCVTATDTFSVDGTTVLLERGTKLVGETHGDVRQGAARVFVLWTEARSPTGVVVELASPGTDELGRSGLPGQVNRHFFQRFGAAMLISVIDGAVQSAVQSSRSGGAVVYNPSASEDITTEVLKSTVNIPPTVTKHQGDRIQVLVARDLDFRSVYELRPTARRR